MSAIQNCRKDDPIPLARLCQSKNFSFRLWARAPPGRPGNMMSGLSSALGMSKEPASKEPECCLFVGFARMGSHKIRMSFGTHSHMRSFGCLVAACFLGKPCHMQTTGTVPLSLHCTKELRRAPFISCRQFMSGYGSVQSSSAPGAFIAQGPLPTDASIWVVVM